MSVDDAAEPGRLGGRSASRSALRFFAPPAASGAAAAAPPGMRRPLWSYAADRVGAARAPSGWRTSATAFACAALPTTYVVSAWSAAAGDALTIIETRAWRPPCGGASKYWNRCVSLDSRQGTTAASAAGPPACFSRTTRRQFMSREMDWLMWFASFCCAPVAAAPVRSMRSEPARSTSMSCTGAPPPRGATSSWQTACDRDDVWFRPVRLVLRWLCAARHIARPCAADVTRTLERFATSILVVTSLTRSARRLGAQRLVEPPSMRS
mmetsp:Transcript_34522/g.104019  ORF Transcript_34522/g.104019 Transcript_34522/m.104019 type:complete len:267 (-) Transcript_34522:753-1553(-)